MKVIVNSLQTNLVQWQDFAQKEKENLKKKKKEKKRSSSFSFASLMSTLYVLEPATTGKVVFKTTYGDIDFELWCKETPKACRNFIQVLSSLSSFLFFSFFLFFSLILIP